MAKRFMSFLLPIFGLHAPDAPWDEKSFWGTEKRQHAGLFQIRCPSFMGGGLAKAALSLPGLFVSNLFFGSRFTP
jgi:hypothetical protein